MPVQSSIHAAPNWTRQRLDEMDATVAALDAQASRASLSAKH